MNLYHRLACLLLGIALGLSANLHASDDYLHAKFPRLTSLAGCAALKSGHLRWSFVENSLFYEHVEKTGVKLSGELDTWVKLPVELNASLTSGVIKMVDSFLLSPEGIAAVNLYNATNKLINPKSRFSSPISEDNCTSFIELQTDISPKFRPVLNQFIVLLERGVIDHKTLFETYGITPHFLSCLSITKCDVKFSNFYFTNTFLNHTPITHMSPLFLSIPSQSLDVTFTGSVFPLNVANHPSLTSLYLTRTHFTDPMSMGALLTDCSLGRNLRGLFLTECTLPEEFLTVLPSMPSLYKCELHRILFQGDIGHLLRNLPVQITWLSLKLDLNEIPDLSHLTRLSHLDLRGNNINPRPSTIYGLALTEFSGLYTSDD